MISRVINILKQIKEVYVKKHFYKSFSQEGEDMILSRIIGEKKDGFYVDVGAHHPKRFSNTYYFYKRGWKGINLDAMPGSMKLFQIIRSRDINLEIPISSNNEELTYYIFNEPALNGFSKILSENRNIEGNDYFIVDEIPLHTQTLTQILEVYLPINTTIDFLTIDVEGLDYEVLKSIDFQKYQPRLILVELLNNNLEEVLKSNVTLFLKSNGYSLHYKTLNTAFFLKNSDLNG